MKREKKLQITTETAIGYEPLLPTVFSSTIEKQQKFYNDLKALLIKYDAELTIEDFGHNYRDDYKIVVDFKYDESFYEKENTGIIPQLTIGTWENGR